MGALSTAHVAAAETPTMRANLRALMPKSCHITGHGGPGGGHYGENASAYSRVTLQHNGCCQPAVVRIRMGPVQSPSGSMTLPRCVELHVARFGEFPRDLARAGHQPAPVLAAHGPSGGQMLLRRPRCSANARIDASSRCLIGPSPEGDLGMAGAAPAAIKDPAQLGTAIAHPPNQSRPRCRRRRGRSEAHLNFSPVIVCERSSAAGAASAAFSAGSRF